MDRTLRSLLDTGDGLITLIECRRSLPRWAIGNARRAGLVRRVLPGVYLDASRCADQELYRRAALAYAGERAALSHTSALALWGLPGSTPGEPTHVTVPRSERVRSRPEVVVHRASDFRRSRRIAGSGPGNRSYRWSGRWSVPGRCWAPRSSEAR